MSVFVFRNQTLEPFFPRGETVFSGYGEIVTPPEDVEKIIWFYTLPPDIVSENIAPTVDDFLQKLNLVLARIPKEKRLELTPMSVPAQVPIALSDTRLADAVAHYNAALREIANERPNTILRDAPPNTPDWRLWFLAQMPFAANAKASTAVDPSVPALRKKCLVLDCDDTLWGGVLGEDGLTGIRLGGDYPGNAFAYFQQRLVELAQSGVILAVASKNNPQDVNAVFEKHPAMRLRREHISVWRVNWNDKAESIREIATELNIGLDSLVFVDNEARERERVETAFGGVVATPEFPKHAYALPDFFETLLGKYFRMRKLTQEDLAKTQQYRDAAARVADAKQFASLEDYIASLNIRLSVAPANDFSFARLAQLTQKTNQFNLTTRRRTEAELRDFVERGNVVLSLSVSDKIGDLGIVGMAEIALSAGGKTAHVENFLMSCRALGRGIETAFACAILNRLAEAGVERISAEYLPTAKNAPCKNFWQTLGFSGEESGTHFDLALRKNEPFKINPAYTFVSNA